VKDLQSVNAVNERNRCTYICVRLFLNPIINDIFSPLTHILYTVYLYNPYLVVFSIWTKEDFFASKTYGVR